MNIEAHCLGMLQTNCYIIWNDEKDAFIIDPSCEPYFLSTRIKELELTVHSILLTHAHFDHIGAVPELHAELNVPVYLHPDDLSIYNSPDNSVPNFWPAAENLPDTRPDYPTQAVSGLAFETFHTPGHSPGSLSFFFKEHSVLISGDVLFQGSIGRTDLPGGNQETLVASIRNCLYQLDDHIRVLPGHGDETTIGTEKSSNPFVPATPHPGSL